MYLLKGIHLLSILLHKNNDLDMYLLKRINTKRKALYYLSQTLIGVEANYSILEKMCPALIILVQKLQHHMLTHIVHLSMSWPN